MVPAFRSKLFVLHTVLPVWADDCPDGITLLMCYPWDDGYLVLFDGFVIDSNHAFNMFRKFRPYVYRQVG